jgi:hypothetical protein
MFVRYENSSQGVGGSSNHLVIVQTAALTTLLPRLAALYLFDQEQVFTTMTGGADLQLPVSNGCFVIGDVQPRDTCGHNAVGTKGDRSRFGRIYNGSAAGTSVVIDGASEPFPVHRAARHRRKAVDGVASSHRFRAS